MENYLRYIREAGREVYSHRSYWGIALLSAALLYALNAVFQNFRLLRSSFSFSLLWSLIFGLKATFTPFSYVLLVLVVLLGGVAISFSIYLLRRQVAQGASAGIGAVAAILAPACPSCAFGVLGAVGLGGVAAFLPFGGIELGILALVLLVVSVGYLSKKMVTATCTLSKKR